MSRIENKVKVRQMEQTPLVEYSELSGIDLIYPSDLIIGDSTDDYLKPLNEIVIVEDNNNGLIALIDSKTHNSTIPETELYVKEKKQKYKMDTLTQIYVGSLTIIGLFVVYRLINKSK